MLRVAATGFAKKDAYLVVHVRGAMAQYTAYLVKAIRRPITCTLECLIKLDGLRLSFNYVHFFFLLQFLMTRASIAHLYLIS